MASDRLDAALFLALSVFEVIALAYALFVLYRARRTSHRMWVGVGPVLMLLLLSSLAALVGLLVPSTAHRAPPSLLAWATSLYALLAPVVMARIVALPSPRERTPHR